MDNLPIELETEPLAQKSEIVDAAGNTDRHDLRREPRQRRRSTQVSRTMVKAIVAIEDYRFYQHGALDLKGTLRALLTNQANSGVVQGGSSITQQMVKLTLHRRRPTPRRSARPRPTTPTRASSASCATRSPSSRSTPRTGSSSATSTSPTSATAPTASRRPPSTTSTSTPSDLNLNQSAMLAGLVQNPTAFDPTNSPDRALDRRNVVLDRMAELNVITREQGRHGQGGGPRARRRSRPRTAASTRARRSSATTSSPTCARTSRWASNPEERMRLLKSGGLTIKTTIDLREQAAADKAVAAHVFPQGAGDRRRWPSSSRAPAR